MAGGRAGRNYGHIRRFRKYVRGKKLGKRQKLQVKKMIAGQQEHKFFDAYVGHALTTNHLTSGMNSLTSIAPYNLSNEVADNQLVTGQYIYWSSGWLNRVQNAISAGPNALDDASGRRIRMTGLDLRYAIYCQPALVAGVVPYSINDYFRYRVLVVRYKRYAINWATQPPIAEVLDLFTMNGTTTGAEAFTAHYNKEYRKQFEVLYDKVHVLSPNLIDQTGTPVTNSGGVGGNKNYCHGRVRISGKKLGKLESENTNPTGAQGIAAGQRNQLALYIVYDGSIRPGMSSITTGTMTGQSRLTYVDMG